MLIPIVFSLALLTGIEAPDTLVICPQALQPTLQTWVDYRTKQGHRVLVQEPANSSFGIRLQVRRAARSGKLKNLLLIGDAGDVRANPSMLVVTDYVKAQVNVKFGSEPEIATDNTYVDLDNDGSPDLTLGRIPVDSAKELKQFIDRIVKYESTSSVGPWMRRVNFIAGVGGFGLLVDKLIEQSTKQMITDLIPSEYQTSMTQGSWASPYCPDPRRFSETTVERFNEGCLFWTYIGHGSVQRLDRVMLPDGRYDILDMESVQTIHARAGFPIAIFLACYTGATDGQHDCLAEQMLRQDNGPIAIIGSSRVSMPYAMAVLSLELLDEYFVGDSETLGQLFLRAKQRMVAKPKDPNEYRMMIEGMGKMFSPDPRLMDQERAEHVHLMHLLGDPLLRLKRPSKIGMETLNETQAGQALVVKGVVPSAGDLTIDLSYKRDRFRKRPPRRREYDSSNEVFESYDKVYKQTHDLICWRQTFAVPAGQFSIKIPVPIDANGECVVGAMLESNTIFALGSAPVFIKDVDD